MAPLFISASFIVHYAESRFVTRRVQNDLCPVPRLWDTQCRLSTGGLPLFLLPTPQASQQTPAEMVGLVFLRCPSLMITESLRLPKWSALLSLGYSKFGACWKFCNTSIFNPHNYGYINITNMTPDPNISHTKSLPIKSGEWIKDLDDCFYHEMFFTFFFAGLLKYQVFIMAL